MTTRIFGGLALLATLMLACATTGKGSLGERVAGDAAEGALEQSLVVLDRPENQARLARVIGSPPLQEALRDTTSSMVAGIVDGVVTAGDSAKLRGMGAGLGRSLGDTLDNDISPAAARFTSRSVDAALGAALAERHTARLEDVVRRLGAAAASTMNTAMDEEISPALAAAIERDLGPALAVAVERDLLPAVGRGLQSPEMQQAIIRSTASIGVGAARGAERGLSEVRSGNGPDGSGVRLFGRTLAVGLVVAVIIALAFAVALVVLVVMLVRSSRRQRQMYEDSRRREMLLLELFQRRAESDPEQPVVTSQPTQA